MPRIELHLHTAEHSRCGKVSARGMIRYAYEHGLHGVALTDHHYLWSQDEVEELRRRARVPQSFGIFRGQECTTRNVGDVLIFGAHVTVRQGTPVEAIRSRYPHAAIVVAHPYRYARPTDRLLTYDGVDAIEVLHPSYSPRVTRLALEDWRRLGFTATGSSDAHRLEHIGVHPTRFERLPLTLGGLVTELRAGRCSIERNAREVA
jgi:predicted metal-dependent phosphoesterase TrpH